LLEKHTKQPTNTPNNPLPTHDTLGIPQAFGFWLALKIYSPLLLSNIDLSLTEIENDFISITTNNTIESPNGFLRDDTGLLHLSVLSVLLHC